MVWFFFRVTTATPWLSRVAFSAIWAEPTSSSRPALVRMASSCSSGRKSRAASGSLSL